MLLCVNPDSIPACTTVDADTMILGIINGIQQMGKRIGIFDFAIYSDCDTILNTVIGPDYTVRDFTLKFLYDSEYRDAVSTFINSSDHSSYIEKLSDDELSFLVDVSVFAFSSVPVSNNELFWFIINNNGVLLSFPTRKMWMKGIIPLQVRKHNSLIEKKSLWNLFNEKVVFLPEKEQGFSLSDDSRFISTRKKNKESYVYYEKKYKRYWYFDGFHKTHYEVFSHNRRHYGEANLDGNIDRNKRDPKKRLEMK